MRDPSCRSLTLPLLLSVLLHAALLAGAPRVAPGPASGGRRNIEATIVVRPRLTVAEAALGRVASAANASEATNAARPVAKSSEGSVRRVAKRTRVAPSATVSDRTQQRVAALARAQPVEPAVSDSAASDGRGEDALSAGALRQYRLALAIAARRFRAYPDLARAHGWQGTVTVALEIGVLRPAPRVVLLRSSGHPLLDAQAIEMVSQAAGATAFPAVLKRRDRRIVIPVEFSLADGGNADQPSNGVRSSSW